MSWAYPVVKRWGRVLIEAEVIEDMLCEAMWNVANVQDCLAKTPEEKHAGVGRRADHPEWHERGAAMRTTTDHALMPKEDGVAQWLREGGAGSLEDVPRFAELDGARPCPSLTDSAMRAS